MKHMTIMPEIEWFDGFFEKFKHFNIVDWSRLCLPRK